MLLDRIRAFADSAGLGGCLQSAPTSPSGYRLSALPLDDSESPARWRAWWLLAGVCGQVEPDAMVPIALDRGFFAWLADPDDASASAFWDVLTTLRGSRGVSTGPRAGEGSNAD